MEAKEKVNLKIKVRKEVNGLDTKLYIIQKLIKEKEPITMYQFAKETNMPTSQVSYHFKTLINCGVILLYKRKYQINPCFKYIDEILETLNPFFQCLNNLNPTLNEDQLTDLASYILAISTIEVEDNETET